MKMSEQRLDDQFIGRLGEEFIPLEDMCPYYN